MNSLGRASKGANVRSALLRLVEAGTSSAGARRTTVRDVESLMRAILCEIDETVLPRQITLFTKTGAVARMLISNRRLVSLDIDNDPEDEQAGLPTDPESAARLYAQRLQSVFERSGEVSFRLTGRALQTGTPNISCSARVFAETTGLPLLANEPAQKIDTFLEYIKLEATAWIRAGQGGAGVQQDGGDDLLARLRAFQDHVAPAIDQKKSTPRVKLAEATCQIIPVGQDAAMICANDRTEWALAMIASDQIETAMQGWASVYQ